ncbi:MAG: shikimate dehydrogenase [Gemmatimonadota bacterium]
MSFDADDPTLYALLGDPVDHSLSPAIHNAAFQALGFRAVYVSVRIEEAGLLESVMRALAVPGGGGNVTTPHKGQAATVLNNPSAAVRATGACNLFWWDEGAGLCGDNTDIESFRIAAEHVVGSGLAGLKVLVLGAGGAARAVVYGCVRQATAGVDVLNRTPSRASDLLRQLGHPAGARALPGVGDLATEGYDLIVNATSLGLRESDPLPLQLGGMRAGAVLDLVYGPKGTRFVAAARDAGLKAEDGRRMLVEQAAAALEVWLGRPAPKEVMQGAVGLG